MVCNYVWDLAGFLDRVPAVIWSGVIGATIAAGISYFGIRSANKSSLDRLRIQHVQDEKEANAQRDHDTLQKAEDRKAAIRREVYIQAVEEAHNLIAHIGRLPDLPLATKDADAVMQSFLKTNAKIWLVAESDAAHLSRELASRFSEALFAASAAAYQFRVDMDPVRDLDAQLVRAETEAARCRLRLDEAKERGEPIEVMERIGKSLTAANNWVQAVKASQHNERLLRKPQRLELARQTMEVLRPVQALLVQVVSSLRGELDLPPELEEFQRQHTDMERRACSTLDRAFGVEPAAT
jgi:hypothetical protein